MKRSIYRVSIVFPLLLVYTSFVETVSFSVPELNIYIEPVVARFLITMGTTIWLCCSPYKRYCCNGTWTELMFNLVPIEAVLMLNLAQWHFATFVIISLVLVFVESALFIGLRRDARKHPVTNKSRRMYKTIFRRCTVLAIAVICVIPCCPSLFMHGLTSPTYQAQQEIWRYIFSEDTESEDTIESVADAYTEYQELWRCLEESTWKHYSVPEKMTVMQRLTDFETQTLGISSVPVTADLIGSYTLGMYNEETNELFINTKYLDTSPVEECIDTICHEVRHALQFQVVNAIDWDNPVFQTAYFDELRSWLHNQEDYQNAWLGGFEEYHNQPLEVDARDYAATETERIMSYIHGDLQG